MTNRQSFQDGKIVLYQLEDRPKGLWLCRLKVPNGSGYVYRGTGTSDPYEARRFADDLLDQLKIKAKLGEAITGRMFREMVAEYKASVNAKGSPTSREQGIIDFLETYAVKYFTKVRITEISSIDVSRFFDWRRKNSIKKKTPKETTIVHEISKLKSFFDWCHKRGMISSSIEIENPKHKITRRPHFDKKDWNKLTRFLREWVKQGKNKSGPILRDRIMLTNYVLILANSGIRVGEARNLKWRDVESDTKDGVVNIILHVKGKTGSREVVARKAEIMEYFEAIWELRKGEIEKAAKSERSPKSDKAPKKDDFIFCHSDGKPIHTFKKGFLTMIQEAGVEKDANGERRTIYSLRHTYATFRLQEGVNHYVLAKNMGTSVKMLENFYGHTSNRAMAEELTKHKNKSESVLPWEQPSNKRTGKESQ